MLVHLLIIDNVEELEKAEKLGIALPPLHKINRKLVLDINDVQLMYMSKSNTIEIQHSGYFYELEYNKSVWDSIAECINKRELNNNKT